MDHGKNLLAGALYGTFEAIVLTSFLTSIGASAAYYLSKYAGKPLVDQCFSEKLLNLTSPLLSIPISSFFTSMFFGSIPYNLACAQAGNILSELQSTTDIWQPVLLLKMILVSLLSLLPPLIVKEYSKIKILLVTPN
ncbi:3491_t:CDS:2 [Diversispora eburnea]|uniref:3491_t:CDS:1 n=1 Tax=Diversispora eburnea TaxID=1213867 RepID=A0A9N9ADY2_9GLOM|nr:3491_t:CDS:2 [Diversispora eburnea]